MALDQGKENYGLWAKISLSTVFVKKKKSFIGTQPHSLIYIFPMAAFMLQWQR